MNAKRICAFTAAAAAAVLLAACAPQPEAAAPVTVVTEEKTSSAESTAAEETGSFGYTQEDLDGVAGKYDPVPMRSTFSEAKEKNDEVIGWITIDGTVIDYPVLRTDNNDFYLTHDAEGNDSKYGAVFMDYRNSESHMQKHIIVYGHNMKNGTMFHDLVNYKQKDFFTRNSRVYLLWDGTDTEWEIFCAYIVAPDTIYPIHTLFPSDEGFASVMNDTIKYAKTVRPSCVDDSVTLQPSDQVLSLITCTYEYDDSRFVVMARRVK